MYSRSPGPHASPAVLTPCSAHRRTRPAKPGQCWSPTLGCPSTGTWHGPRRCWRAHSTFTPFSRGPTGTCTAWCAAAAASLSPRPPRSSARWPLPWRTVTNTVSSCGISSFVALSSPTVRGECGHRELAHRHTQEVGRSGKTEAGEGQEALVESGEAWARPLPGSQEKVDSFSWNPLGVERCLCDNSRQ